MSSGSGGRGLPPRSRWVGIAFIGGLLLVALIVTRTCGSQDNLVTDDEAVAAARGGDRLRARAHVRALPAPGRPLAARTTPSPSAPAREGEPATALTTVLVDARSGEVDRGQPRGLASRRPPAPARSASGVDPPGPGVGDRAVGAHGVDRRHHERAVRRADAGRRRRRPAPAPPGPRRRSARDPASDPPETSTATTVGAAARQVGEHAAPPRGTSRSPSPGRRRAPARRRGGRHRDGRAVVRGQRERRRLRRRRRAARAARWPARAPAGRRRPRARRRRRP